jgi:RNA polymerase sigma factor (sigma-70 family)
MDARSDASLVAEALDGEAEPFCVLVRRYQDHAYGVALGVLADFEAALDAAQEAFLCAYCDLAKLRDPARFGAWLCGIARNTAFEISRDQQRRADLVKHAAQRVDSEATVPSAELLAMAAEQRESVQAALRRVNEKDREVLTLYYADGLSYAEVCGFLGISIGTLKGRLQRGRAALRKELAMVEQACKDNAPDRNFAGRLAEAIRVFGGKGPPTNHIPSPWHDQMRAEARAILRGGEEGLRIDLAMSHSGSARVRHHAAVHFGLRRDPRSLAELERMLEDRSPRVRRTAVRGFAARIHPAGGTNPPGLNPDLNVPAASAGEQFERLLTRLADENHNVRLYALMAVGAYRDSGDPRVQAALERALADPKHKVCHAAARILRVPCRGCGKTW